MKKESNKTNNIKEKWVKYMDSYGRIPRTLKLNANVYIDFKEECRKRGFEISKQVENFMSDQLIKWNSKNRR